MLALCTLLLAQGAAAADPVVTLALCEAKSEDCLTNAPAACIKDGFTVEKDLKGLDGDYYNHPDFTMVPTLTSSPNGDDCTPAWEFDYAGGLQSSLACHLASLPRACPLRAAVPTWAVGVTASSPFHLQMHTSAS